MSAITSYLSTWRAISNISSPFPTMASEDMEASQVLGKRCSQQLSLNIVDGYCINSVYQLHPASWAATFFLPDDVWRFPEPGIPCNVFLGICWSTEMGFVLG